MYPVSVSISLYGKLNVPSEGSQGIPRGEVGMHMYQTEHFDDNSG